MLLERVRQLSRAVHVSPTRKHDALAAEWLLPAELALYERLSPYDREHSLALAGALIKRGFVTRSLMACALLHDVGKSVANLHPMHRAAFVLAQRLHPRLPGVLGVHSRRSWRYPLWVLCHHAELGARLAHDAGVDARVVRLIRYHDSDVPDPQVRLFQLVDDGR